jgi:predicted MFS family arabinose efflux permease
MGGIGTALLFTPCIAAIGHYFCHGRGNATGIAVSSGALGGIAFPFMLENLFPRIGFAWTTRIVGLIYMVLCITANLLIKSRLPPTKNASANPDFRIFRDPIFALTVAGVFLLEWALFIPLAYISSYAAAQGFSDVSSYQTLVMLNVGSFFGRVLPGYIADRIGRYNTNVIVILLAIISVFGIWLPFGANIVGLAIFTILFGFASGSNISMAPVSIGQLCETENYGRYYATCFTVVSLGCLTGIPIAGAITDVSNGSYEGLILFTGSCYIGGLVAISIARVLAKGWDLTAKY